MGSSNIYFRRKGRMVTCIEAIGAYLRTFSPKGLEAYGIGMEDKAELVAFVGLVEGVTHQNNFFFER